MAQAPVMIPVLKFPVFVLANNIVPIPQAAYNTHAQHFYPLGVFNVTRAQADEELLKAGARIRDLQWIINHTPEAGSPNSKLGKKLRAQYVVHWDRADYCLRLK